VADYQHVVNRKCRSSAKGHSTAPSTCGSFTVVVAIRRHWGDYQVTNYDGTTVLIGCVAGVSASSDAQPSKLQLEVSSSTDAAALGAGAAHILLTPLSQCTHNVCRTGCWCYSLSLPWLS
jgi:hypothetical protein